MADVTTLQIPKINAQNYFEGKIHVARYKIKQKRTKDMHCKEIETCISNRRCTSCNCRECGHKSQKLFNLELKLRR